MSGESPSLAFSAVGPLSFEQAAVLLLLLGVTVVFALDRFRIELVALAGLALAFALGLVPASGVFAGFSNPAVITVAEILLIIQALARSRIVERFSERIGRLIRGDIATLAFLCAVSGFLSIFMNNIGALALMLPVALSLSARAGMPLQRTLMPVSFATLLGGLCSVIGTPANLVVSQARAEAVGRPFALFDLAHVGIPVAVVGILFLVAWTPRRFGLRHSDRSGGQGMRERKLVTEIRLPPASPLAGRTVPDLEAALGARVFSVVREGRHVFGRPRDQTARGGDILVVEIAAGSLEAMREAGTIELAQAGGPDSGRVTIVEVVLMPQSIFVGSRVGTLAPLTARGIAVIGIVPQRPRVEGRLADVQLSIGDILVLSGPEDAIDDALDETDLLRLSSRETGPPMESSYTAVTVFAIGVLAAAFAIVPPEIALGLVVLVLAATGSLRLREALQNLNWPILILLAAMIPLGTAVETTGAARSLSEALVRALPVDDPVAIVGCVLLIAVALTPFVNNVSTAVILSPIAVEIARASDLPAEPFLIAVALGASLDFLTPFGHHNNTLVMGVAGYRFSDFPRLGAPLLVVTFATGLFGISLFWL